MGEEPVNDKTKRNVCYLVADNMLCKIMYLDHESHETICKISKSGKQVMQVK